MIMKSNAVSNVISTEVLSVLVCLILAYGNLFKSHTVSKRGRIYTIMVFTNILALVSDGISWFLDGQPDRLVLLYISTTLSICLSLVLLGQFALYIKEYVFEITDRKDHYLRVVLLLMLVLTAASFAMCVSGKLFSFRDGFYSDGPLYTIYLLFNFILMIVSAAVVFVNRRALGKHDSTAAYVYLAIPFVSTVISFLSNGVSYAYQASTLSLLIFFIFIQSEQNHKLEQEKQTNRYIATHDELTGLESRRAFTERSEQLAETEGTVGLIFCDINGLKYENDHFGHRAGDRKLVDFARLLEQQFPDEELFRISGDEFIVFITNKTKEYYDAKVRNFEKALHCDGTEIACIGSEYGSCRKVEELQQMAENKMYRKKEEYHRNHPETSR